jgi:hypothetical protein
MASPRILLLGRPGCHLCDDARAVISRVADDLGVGWEERDITQSEADLREYWEMIPVTFVDGDRHDFWRVSEERLRQALKLFRGSVRAFRTWVVLTLCICSQTTYGRWVARRPRVPPTNAGHIMAWPVTAPNRPPGASHVQCRRAVRASSRVRQ